MADKTEGLDEILNRSTETAPQEKQEAAPAVESKPEAVTGDKPTRDRDDKGKFAKANPDAEPDPVLTGERQEAPPASIEQDGPRHGFVPIAALVDTRLEARLAKQEAEALRKQLADLQKPKDMDAEPIDFFTDPDAAIRQSLSPVEQRLEQMERQWTLRASRAEALATIGKEAVDAAEQAVKDAMDANDPEVFQLREIMMRSAHPVEEAVKWHQRRSVLHEVGDDPVAYKERLKAELLAELQGTQPAQPATQRQNPSPAVMPSNLAGARNVGARTGPAWAGPQPIQDIFDRK